MIVFFSLNDHIHILDCDEIDSEENECDVDEGKAASHFRPDKLHHRCFTHAHAHTHKPHVKHLGIPNL